jgi:hypothetical protein
MVVPPDEATQPLRQRVNEALAGDDGRHHDQGTIAAVLAEAVRPRDAGAVEGLMQDLIELLVQVEADIIVAVRAGEPGDVHREQGTHLPVSRRGGRPGRWAAHGWPTAGTGSLALAIRSSAQKLIRSSSLSDRGEMPAGKGPAGGQRPVRDEDRRQDIVATIGRLSSGLPASGRLRAGITLGNSGGIPRAERAQDSSVVHASSPSRRWRGRAVRRLVAFCPTSGPRNTGRSSGFRLLGCRAGSGITAGNQP